MSVSRSADARSWPAARRGRPAAGRTSGWRSAVDRGLDAAPAGCAGRARRRRAGRSAAGRPRRARGRGPPRRRASAPRARGLAASREARRAAGGPRRTASGRPPTRRRPPARRRPAPRRCPVNGGPTERATGVAGSVPTRATERHARTPWPPRRGPPRRAVGHRLGGQPARAARPRPGCARPRPLPARGELDERADGERDQRGTRQGDQAVAVLDRERVQRRGEEEVRQQERPRPRRRRRGPDAADDRDHDDGEQEEQQRRWPAPGRRAAVRAPPVSSGRRASAPGRAPAPRRTGGSAVSRRGSAPSARLPHMTSVAPLVDTGASARDAAVDRPSRSCHGTLVTITPGRNSSRALSRSALWLCSRCSHQCPTTYSGMNTDDHVARAGPPDGRRRSPAPAR